VIETEGKEFKIEVENELRKDEYFRKRDVDGDDVDGNVVKLFKKPCL